MAPIFPLVNSNKNYYIINMNKKLKKTEKLMSVYNHLKPIYAEKNYSNSKVLDLARRAIKYFEIEEDQIDRNMIREYTPKPNYFTYDLVDALTNRQFEILSRESKRYQIYG